MKRHSFSKRLFARGDAAENFRGTNEEHFGRRRQRPRRLEHGQGGSQIGPNGLGWFLPRPADGRLRCGQVKDTDRLNPMDRAPDSRGIKYVTGNLRCRFVAEISLRPNQADDLTSL